MNHPHSFQVKVPLDRQSSQIEPREGHFFLPPFPLGDFNASRLESFCRSTLADFTHCILLAAGELIRPLSVLSSLLVKPRTSRQLFFREAGEHESLESLYESIPTEDAVLISLSRKFDEMELLALNLVFSQWQRVFLSPTHGALAEGARLLRIPFFPVDLSYSRFWHDSELLYLSLALQGCQTEEVHWGFERGYRECFEGCRRLALLLWQMEKSGCRQVFFLARTPFFRAIFEAMIPLLEESSGEGTAGISYRTVSPDTFKEHYCDQVCRTPASALCLWVDERPRVNGPQIRCPDILRENVYLDSRFFHLDGKPLSLLTLSESLSLKEYLTEKAIPVVTLSGFTQDDCSLGGLLSMLQLFTCFNAWHRGIDVFNDPSRVEADGRAWELIASSGKRTRARKP